tara:strand:- start:974 stop:2122 length:1149 start_codon:yes stop_codon:yes gene_type:complete
MNQPISFQLSEDQQAFRAEVKRFMAETVIPHAGEWDETGYFPRAELNAAWEMGIMNLCIPEAQGGSGMSLLDTVIIGEEVAYGCTGYSTSMMANELALAPIVLGASEEDKEKWLRPFTEEPRLACFCLSEPGAGSDAGSLRTRATLEGDEWVLNGSKQWITNSTHADLYVVFATTDTSLRQKGIGIFLVERGTPGLTVMPHENKMGQRSSDTAPLVLENCRIPKANCVVEPGKGWAVAMKTLDYSRPMVASAAVGLAQRCLDESIGYAKERKTFGKPIAQYQSIGFKIADMAIKTEASRLLCYKAAWLCDQGLSNNAEASYAKAAAADWAMEIAVDAVQVFGGYGYVKEYPVEKLMRDAKLIQIYEGTSQIQRLIITRELFR